MVVLQDEGVSSKRKESLQGNAISTRRKSNRDRVQHGGGRQMSQKTSRETTKGSSENTGKIRAGLQAEASKDIES